MTQTQINRRRALAVVASVPAAVAIGSVALASAGEDAELLELGEHCKALALETARLEKLFRKASRQQEWAFNKMKPERWCCHYPSYQGGGVVRQASGTWEVLAVDGAPTHFDVWLDIEPPEELPAKWIPLAASNRVDAEKEATILDRKLDAEFFKKRKQAGVAFNRDAHYKNWTRSLSKLRRAVRALAKLRATTPEGLSIKATVLAIAHDAFDDPNIWNEPLQKSITRDIKGMAA